MIQCGSEASPHQRLWRLAAPGRTVEDTPGLSSSDESTTVLAP